MRINRLKIDSFGKLNDVTVSLDDKITVITGENEAGKSTISSFIKYMLYGFDGSKKQNAFDNQKIKYTPWSGEGIKGEMDFTTSDGKSFVAIRRTEKRSSATVFDSDGNVVTAENAGDFFLGVGETAYKKTAYIGASNTAFSDDGELALAIRNIIFSADESADSQKALKKLEDIRKFYLGRAERSGKIFELERELSQLKDERERLKDSHRELLGAEFNLKKVSENIARNKACLEKLKIEQTNLEYFKAGKRLCQISEAKNAAAELFELVSKKKNSLKHGSDIPDNKTAEIIGNTLSAVSRAQSTLENASAEYSSAKQGYERITGQSTQKGIFSRLSESGKTADEVISKIDDLSSKAKKYKTLGIVFTLLIITLPLAIFFYYKSGKAKKELQRLCKYFGVKDETTLKNVLLGGGGYFEAQNSARQYLDRAEESYKRAKEELEKNTEALAVLGLQYGFDKENARIYLEKLKIALNEIQNLEQALRDANVAADTLEKSIDVERYSEMAGKYDPALAIHDEKELAKQLGFYSQSIDGLEMREREYEKKVASLSGSIQRPSEIQSKILSIEENLAEMRQKHAAIVLAIEALEIAGEGMKSEAAPKIAAETSRLFSSITNGKYRSVYPDNDMKLSFLAEGDAAPRDAGFLSTGALDAAYISLRLALCKFLYKEAPTLIFDDAFSHLDDDRLGATLRFLKEMSADFQIVILSCHKREMEFFKDSAKCIQFKV